MVLGRLFSVGLMGDELLFFKAEVENFRKAVSLDKWVVDFAVNFYYWRL